MSYIPLSKMAGVSAQDFHQVARHGDLGTECPSKLSGDVRVFSITSVDVKPATCRDEEEGKVFLCNACTNKYQYVKEAMGEGAAADEVVYLPEEANQTEASKPAKNRAVAWVKAHPVLAALAGVTIAVGVVAGLAGYFTRPFAPSSNAATGDAVKPTVTPTANGNLTATPLNAVTTQALNTTLSTSMVATTSKSFNATAMPTKSMPTKSMPTKSTPTTTMATFNSTGVLEATTFNVTTTNTTTATSEPELTRVTTNIPTNVQTEKPKGRAKLNLAIFNAQNKQVLNIQSTQRFEGGQSWVTQSFTVPKFGNTTLTFDIHKDNHKDIRVSYNGLTQSLRDANNLDRKISNTQIFGKDYAEVDSNGDFVKDANKDGKIVATHVFFGDDQHYLLSQDGEDQSGQAPPSVSTSDATLLVKNQGVPLVSRIEKKWGGKWSSIAFTLATGSETRQSMKIGTQEFRATFSWGDKTRIINRLAHEFPTDVKGEMCLQGVQSYGQLQSGNC